ncbi:MAG: AEC family transporter [Eubacteriaceae bacterium]|nr:AEC family transporter [Eubacteriaceae bacterium]
MIEFSQVINQVIILFLIAAIGFAAGKRGVIKSEQKEVLSKMLINVALPCMLIDAVMSTTDRLSSRDFLITISISICTYIIGFVLAWYLPKLLKLDSKKKGLYSFSMLYTNVGFLGFPILAMVLGKASVIYAIIFNITYYLTFFPVGFYLLRGEKTRPTLKEMLPIITIVFFISLMLYLLKIPLPYPVLKTVSIVGGMTLPLSMLFVGLCLCEVHISVFKNINVILVSIYRVLLFPAAMYFILTLFTDNFYYIAPGVIMFAMPVAALLPAFAKECNLDEKEGAVIVTVSTLFMLFALPLIGLLLSMS